MKKDNSNIERAKDLELISDYRRTGDKKILGRFFKKYMAMVYGVCLKYLQNEEDSKDAVMDIFEKLSDKLRSHEISYPKSWLYTVTRNHCYEILRKNTRFEEKEINARLMYSEEVFRPFEDEEKEQQLTRLEDCIRKLEPMQQHSIRLFYLEKKTYKEVCEIMSIKWDRARSLIQNGRRNLKICMEA